MEYQIYLVSVTFCWVNGGKLQDFLWKIFYRKGVKDFTSELKYFCVRNRTFLVSQKTQIHPPELPKAFNFIFFLIFPSRAPQWQMPALSTHTCTQNSWCWPRAELGWGHPKVGWLCPPASSWSSPWDPAQSHRSHTPFILMDLLQPLKPFFLQNSPLESVALTHLVGLIAWKVPARPWTRWY